VDKSDGGGHNRATPSASQRRISGSSRRQLLPNERSQHPWGTGLWASSFGWRFPHKVLAELLARGTSWPRGNYRTAANPTLRNTPATWRPSSTLRGLADARAVRRHRR
jgi:hypothetical protein